MAQNGAGVFRVNLVEGSEVGRKWLWRLKFRALPGRVNDMFTLYDLT